MQIVYLQHYTSHISLSCSQHIKNLVQCLVETHAHYIYWIPIITSLIYLDKKSSVYHGLLVNLCWLIMNVIFISQKPHQVILWYMVETLLEAHFSIPFLNFGRVSFSSISGTILFFCIISLILIFLWFSHSAWFTFILISVIKWQTLVI